jgi:hypothetical protein
MLITTNTVFVQSPFTNFHNPVMYRVHLDALLAHHSFHGIEKKTN